MHRRIGNDLHFADREFPDSEESDRDRSMNDDCIAQAVRAHVRDGSSQKELTRSDLERCQRETVRRLEAALVEAERNARTEASPPISSVIHQSQNSVGLLICLSS